LRFLQSYADAESGGRGVDVYQSARYRWGRVRTAIEDGDAGHSIHHAHRVLNQLAKGFRYKEITANLGISAGTLHSYIRNVYEKLHVHSRTEAVVKFLNR